MMRDLIKAPLVHLLFLLLLVATPNIALGQNNYSLDVSGANGQKMFFNDILTLSANSSTISFWAKFSAFGGTAFGAKSTDPNATSQLGYMVNSTSFGVDSDAWGSGNASLTFAVPLLSTGIWYHFVLVRDTGTTRLYMAGTESTTGGIADANDFTLQIIGDYQVDGVFQDSNMIIDEVAVWNVPLSAAAVASLNSATAAHDLTTTSGSYTQTAALQNWWRMGDGTEANAGIQIHDMAGTNDLFMFNMDPATDYLTDVPVGGGGAGGGGGNKLVFTPLPSNPNSLGVEWATQPRVEIQDGSDVLQTSATDDVTITAYTNSNCTGATTGTLSVTTNPETAASGVAQFAGVSFDTAEIIYLEATAPGLTSACIGPISIGPAGGGSISWTWLEGNNVATNTSSSFGPDSPGSREYTSLALAPSGDVWLFGGTAYDSVGTSGYSNELWKWNGSAWSFEKGSTFSGSPNAHATYGNQGTAASANVPGGRYLPAFEADSSGNLWLFGGRGIINSTTAVYTNDVWKFDGTDWTWVAGANTGDPAGSWVSQGTESASAVPGPRRDTASAMDSADNLWIFGGFGYDSVPSLGQLQDLWKFNTSTGNWTWVHGPSTVAGAGTYGTGGSSIPGSRRGARMVVDSNDDLWLYGGYGLDAGVTNSELGDLWKFDTTTEEWTWVSGPNTIDTAGSYGTLGEAGTTFYPGSRQGHSFGIDGSDNLYVFGGDAWDSSSTLGIMNDMWKYDPGTDEWTWISGSNSNASVALGTYGTQGVADENNTPGARERSYLASRAGENTFYLMGGNGATSFLPVGILDDLWEFSAGGLYGESTITGTGPVTADGTSTSTITITLKFSDGSPVAGVVPTFSATDTGSTNSYGTCSSSNTSGVSTCTLSSTYAEVKTLSLVTPHSVTGGTVTFDPGAAAQLAFSALPTRTPIYELFYGDFIPEPVVEIQDAQGNPTLSGTDSITIGAYTDSNCTTSASGTFNVDVNPVTATLGTAAFTGVDYNSLGTIYVKAEASGLTPACEPVEIVNQPIYVAGSASSPGNTSTAITLTKPTGTTQDDVIVVFISARGAATITPPAGWVEIGASTTLGGTIRQSRFYKVATALEGADYSFTIDGTGEKSAGVISTYRYIDTNNPVYNHGDSTSTSGTTNVHDVNPNTGYASNFLVVACSATSDDTITFGAGPTTIGTAASTSAGAGSRNRILGGYRKTGGPGPTSTPNCTFTGGEDAVAQSVVLNPLH